MRYVERYTHHHKFADDAMSSTYHAATRYAI